MPIYRTTQCSEPRQNLFIDLPNSQWHGTMLIDKKTQMPVTNEGLESLSLCGNTISGEDNFDPSLVGLVSLSQIDKYDIQAVYGKNGHAYRFIRESATRDNARDRCKALGGHLAYIRNIEDYELLKNLVNGTAAWIDGNKPNTKDLSKIDIGDLEYLDYSSYPFDGNGGYTAVLINTTGKLADNTPTANYYYICEWDSPTFMEGFFRRSKNAFTHGFGFGRYSYMVSNHPALGCNIDVYNDKEHSHKPYIIDDFNRNIAYILVISPNYTSGRYLVKYDMAENTVIWSKEYKDLYITDHGSTINSDSAHLQPKILKLDIFYQTPKELYCLISVKTKTKNIPNDNYDDFAKGVIVLSKETGNIIYGPEFTTLRPPTDTNETDDTYTTNQTLRDSAEPYTYYTVNTRGTEGTLLPIRLLDKSHYLFYTTVLDSEIDPRLIPVETVGWSANQYFTIVDSGSYRQFNNIKTLSGVKRLSFKAGYVVYNLDTHSFDVDTYYKVDSYDLFHNYVNKYPEFLDEMTDKYGFYLNKMYYTHGTNETRIIRNPYSMRDYIGYSAEDQYRRFLTMLAWQVGYNRGTLYPNKFYDFNEFPKASKVDTDYQDSIVVYTCLGSMVFPYAYRGAEEHDKSFRRVFKFIYDPIERTQRYEEMRMLNMDGEDMSYDDWEPISSRNSTYTQPWIVHTEGKKYLCILANICTPIAHNHYPYDTDDLHLLKNVIFLFEFIDENTLQLRDTLVRRFTDLFWEEEDKFILLRDDRISYYEIHDSKLQYIQHVLPAKSGNKFIFAAMDDDNHLWYYEAIENENTPKVFNQESLNYIDKRLLTRLELIPEKDYFNYNGEPIDTYVDLGARNILGEFLERKFTIKLAGDAHFIERVEPADPENPEEPAEPVVEPQIVTEKIVTTNTAGYLRIPIQITGNNEVHYMVNLIEEV